MALILPGSTASRVPRRGRVVSPTGRAAGEKYAFSGSDSNDGSLGALGVYTYGRLRKRPTTPPDLLYVRLGTGVSAGIVLKGHLVTGGAGLAGELGHVRVRPDGAVCPRCRHRGCLEPLVSRTAVLQRVQRDAENERRPIPATLEEAVTSKHGKEAQQALLEAAMELSTVLAGVVNLLNPSQIVLRGRMAEIGVFNDAVSEFVRRYALDPAVAELDLTT